MHPNYELIPTDPSAYIAHGAMGVVYKARRKADKEVIAYKVVDLDSSNNRAAVQTECDILAKLSHKNIVRYFDIEWRAKQVALYMEYCDSGSLQDLIYANTEKQALPSLSLVRNILSQTLGALFYCYYGFDFSLQDPALQSGSVQRRPGWKLVLHRDIKPANILLKRTDDGEGYIVKLCDFGLSKALDESSDRNAPSTFAGTPDYLAPEINDMQDRIQWTIESDMFSLGATIYSFCDEKGRPPFPPRGFNSGMRSGDSVTLNPRYSGDILPVLVKMLCDYNPGGRPRPNAALFMLHQGK